LSKYYNPTTNLSTTDKDLNNYYQKLSQHKKRSPFIAGMLSAVVPGLGKVYSGKPRQGLYAFLSTTMAALLAYEGYRKHGTSSPNLYIFGTMGAIFYIGNIWGSSLSVHIEKQEFNEQLNQNILFDLRIPVNALLQ